jgi:hypothetical protein
VTDAELRAVKMGTVAAVRAVGPWPVSATLPEYLAAVDRASRAADLAVECWSRWWRRFDPAPDRLEVGSARCNVRR